MISLNPGSVNQTRGLRGTVANEFGWAFDDFSDVSLSLTLRGDDVVSESAEGLAMLARRAVDGAMGQIGLMRQYLPEKIVGSSGAVHDSRTLMDKVQSQLMEAGIGADEIASWKAVPARGTPELKVAFDGTQSGLKAAQMGEALAKYLPDILMI